MTDLIRNLQKKVEHLLVHFPAVVILGARQVGKTELAKMIGPDWQYVDLENPLDLERINRDPVFFFQQYPDNVIIDEAQAFSDLFAVLRGVIDKDRHKKGRFILTGSSSPDILHHVSESLAGRVAIVELGTLKANEVYQTELSPLYKLFEEKLHRDHLPHGQAPLSLAMMQQHWLIGGYPEPVLANNPLFYHEWMDNYRKTYLSRDIAALFPRLNKISYNRFLQMLSQLSGTIVNKCDVARAVEVSEGSIREYLTIAEGTYLWRALPSFEKFIEKTVIKMPKGYIRDSGLLHYLLKITTLDDLYGHPQASHSFEGFVVDEIIKGLHATKATNWQANYYRTKNKAEIDLILEGNFGVLPVEIKMGVRIDRRRLLTLDKFVQEHDLPFGILLNQSEKTEWLTPRIMQLPVGWL